MEKETFSWRKRGASFKYAFHGICRLISREHNAWIHCTVAICVVVVGMALGLSRTEWMVVALCIGGVMAAEGFNSAIEVLADRVSANYDEAIKNAKDLAAGAVLLFVIATVAVGLLIFIPKIIALV